jgi:hypothetical protein
MKRWRYKKWIRKKRRGDIGTSDKKISRGQGYKKDR